MAEGLLPNISFVDPEFALADDGTGGDDHPKADIRRGERFIADVYHALADAGYLDNTVLVITFDEWGGFFEHVRPPRVIDDTNPADVDHTGNSTTPTDGRLVPDYTQLGFRVPAIVVSNRASRRVVHDGPFEHTSTLKMIESTFGLRSLTARDANVVDLRQVLHHEARHRAPRVSSRPAARCQGPPPTPPRSAAPPASRRSLRPPYPRAKRSPGCAPGRSPGIQPEPGWGNWRAACPTMSSCKRWEPALVPGRSPVTESSPSWWPAGVGDGHPRASAVASGWQDHTSGFPPGSDLP